MQVVQDTDNGPPVRVWFLLLPGRLCTTLQLLARMDGPVTATGGLAGFGGSAPDRVWRYEAPPAAGHLGGMYKLTGLPENPQLSFWQFILSSQLCTLLVCY